MRVNATDADEGANAQIYYSLVETSSTAGMFSINHQTGEVMVRQSGTLDREVMRCKQASMTFTVLIHY